MRLIPSIGAACQHPLKIPWPNFGVLKILRFLILYVRIIYWTILEVVGEGFVNFLIFPRFMLIQRIFFSNKQRIQKNEKIDKPFYYDLQKSPIYQPLI